MDECPRFLHSIYCDDVRMEVGSKMTFVGVYQSDLIVQSAEPVNLPKLCVVITAQTPKYRPFKKLTVKLMKDADELQIIEIPFTDLAATAERADKVPKSMYHAYGIVVALQPFKVEGSCTLRVVAETESETLSASGLQVALQPKPD